MSKLHRPRIRKHEGRWLFLRSRPMWELGPLERKWLWEAELWVLFANRPVFIAMLRERGIMLPSPTETTR